MNPTFLLLAALVLAGAYRIYAERKAGKAISPWAFSIISVGAPLLSNITPAPFKMLLLGLSLIHI